MKVTILGHNSALPAFGSHPSAQAVSVYGELLLIDCGEGTQIQMQRYGLRWRSMHHIFISHLHGDHYFGLPGLLNSMSLLGRTAPLHLYAPAELKPIIDSILTVADTVLSYPFYFHALPEGIALLADDPSFSVTCFPVEHRIQCHGFLVERKTRGRKLLPEKCNEYGIPAAYYEFLKKGQDYERKDGLLVKNEFLIVSEIELNFEIVKILSFKRSVHFDHSGNLSPTKKVYNVIGGRSLLSLLNKLASKTGGLHYSRLCYSWFRLFTLKFSGTLVGPYLCSKHELDIGALLFTFIEYWNVTTANNKGNLYVGNRVCQRLRSTDLGRSCLFGAID